MKSIYFYRSTNGHCPVKDFLSGLNDKQAQKVLWVMKVVREIDNVPRQYLKKLVNSDDIWEIRAVVGKDAFRFLGFFDGENLIVLTNSFRKKTRKTPKKEVQLAEKRKKEYLKRKGSHG